MLWLLPVPTYRGYIDRDHVNTINRARLYTQITTGAFVYDNSVHLFGSAKYSVNRAGLDALGAADALVFTNISNGTYGFTAMLSVKWDSFYI